METKCACLLRLNVGRLTLAWYARGDKGMDSFRRQAPETGSVSAGVQSMSVRPDQRSQTTINPLGLLYEEGEDWYFSTIFVIFHRGHTRWS